MTSKETTAVSEDAKQSPIFPFGLPSLLTTLVTAATLLGLCLHLIGDVTHVVYLEALGVQPDLFPQSTEAKVIGGYGSINLLGAMLLKSQLWPRAVALVLSLALYLWILRRPWMVTLKKPSRVQRTPNWLKDIANALLKSILIVAFVGATAYAMLSIGSLPLGLGSIAGELKADMMHEQIRLSERRSELWRGDKREARGHIISANESLIAIYDSDAAAIRTISREGTEIRAALVPADNSEAGKAASP